MSARQKFEGTMRFGEVLNWKLPGTRGCFQLVAVAVSVYEG
jgi:hypothetical protein